MKDYTGTKNYTITTWASGWGIWHARIDGVGGAALYASNAALRARARRAIVRELEARASWHNGRPRFRLRLRIDATDVTHDNRLCSITYAERDD